MRLPIREVGRGGGRVWQGEEVLGIGGLGGIRKVEAAGDENCLVYHHYLIVRNVVQGIQKDGDAALGDKRAETRWLTGSTGVQYDLDGNAAGCGKDESLSNPLAGELVSLDANGLPGGGYLGADLLGATAQGGEVNLHGGKAPPHTAKRVGRLVTRQLRIRL